MLDHRLDPGVAQELQAAVAESRRLVRIDGCVPRGGCAGSGEKTLADVQRRDAVTETDLDGIDGALPDDRVAQSLSFDGARCHREERVDLAVGSRDRSAGPGERFDGGAYPLYPPGCARTGGDHQPLRSTGQRSKTSSPSVMWSASW